jgi:hypothetical protein
LDRAEADEFGGGIGLIELGTGATQDSLYAGSEFSGAEGFGHVVVATQFEAKDSIEFVASGREEDDRRFLGFTHFATEAEAVEFGHEDVKNDEVYLLRVQEAKGLDAIAAADHRKAFSLQGVLDNVANPGFVVDDKDGGHRGEYLRVSAAGSRGMRGLMSIERAHD